MHKVNEYMKSKKENVSIKKEASSKLEGTFQELDRALKKQQQELHACQLEAQEWKDKFLSVSADLQNFKNRIEKERASWADTAQTAVLLPLLSVFDDFDRAFEQHDEQKEDAQSMHAGFTLIHKALHKTLADLGVEPVSDYTTFNPEYHEAIMQVDSPDHESGTIVDVMQKGYVLKGQVLRPAKVSVAK